MSLNLTILLFAVAAVAALISVLGLRRPPDLGRLWSPPYHFILFVAFLIMIVMAAHIVSLVSGQPFTGRLGN